MLDLFWRSFFGVFLSLLNETRKGTGVPQTEVGQFECPRVWVEVHLVIPLCCKNCWGYKEKNDLVCCWIGSCFNRIRQSYNIDMRHGDIKADGVYAGGWRGEMRDREEYMFKMLRLEWVCDAKGWFESTTIQETKGSCIIIYYCSCTQKHRWESWLELGELQR